ncbi:MAG: PEP/pyruvate-binding domain-containing protein [Candidatus Levybacteria bacterium]|nr:PEP/pyruvate-binding domain-containing protein [Candidatus Levybacteria bacterium]
MQDFSSVLVWLDDVKAEDEYLVGTKAAYLADLARLGFPFPPAFIITSNAYTEFLKYNNLEIKIKHLLNSINYNDPKSIKDVAAHIKKYILAGQISKYLSKKIFKAYRQLGGILKDSAVNLEISYFDKHLSGKNLKNIKGESTLLEKIKLIWSSIFSPEKYPSIVVSKVLENSISGVMLTDDFSLSKYSISDSQIMELVLLGRKLKKHLYFPQEINWSIYKNKVYFTKIKPMTFIKNANKKVFRSPLLKGFSFGRGVTTGFVKKVIALKDIYNLKSGDIAVASFISEDMLPFLLKTKGLVTDGTIEKNKIHKYLKLSSMPVVTDTKVATKLLRDGIAITINCSLGEVYKGSFA